MFCCTRRRLSGILSLFVAFCGAQDNSGSSASTIIGPELSRTVGLSLFTAHPSLEASGLVWLPHENLLCGVSDRGDVFMINPDDDSEYYLAQNVLGRDSMYDDFEGVSFDPYLVEMEGDNHIYVASEEPAALLKFQYQLPASNDQHSFRSISLSKVVSLSGALPRFKNGAGVESLTLYQPSTATADAIFFVGVQDNGCVYQVDSEGNRVTKAKVISVGGSVVRTGVSGSQYDATTDTLYLVYDKEDGVAAVRVGTNRVMARFRSRSTHEEGLALRDKRVYIASDEGGDGVHSFISEHDWFPELPPPGKSGNGLTNATTNLIQAVVQLVLELLVSP